jgi:hypothetical protein
MVTGQSAVGIGAIVGKAIGEPAVITAIGAPEQRSNRQLDSGPTCRLASSPEGGLVLGLALSCKGIQQG